MASQTVDLNAELKNFAEPLIQGGLYADTADVLHAAMDALRREQEERAFNEALVAAADEGEASGLAEGDIFDRVLAKYGLRAGADS